ncbi:hypothetical protein HK100_001578, partial [Physocladia obscura]
MFKLLKKSTFDNLIAKTKNLGLSSKSQSPIPSKPGTPSKEVDTSNLTLNAISIEELAAIESKESLAVLDIPGSPSTSYQDLSSATTTLPNQTEQDFEQPGLLSIRVVETRNLNPSGKSGNEAPIGLMPFLVAEFDKNETVAWGKETKLDDSGRPVSGNVVNWNFRTNFDVSRQSDLVVTVYQKGEAKSGDIALGTARITPFFDNRLQDEWFKLYPISSSHQQTQQQTPPASPQPSSVGEIRIQLVFKKNCENGDKKALSVDDFEILKVLGKGSFGKVVQVRKRDTGRIYAMKILKKSSIVERDEVEHTLAERNVLAKVSHPFIVNIKFSFQSKDKLYLVLAFVNGGELFHHLQLQ